jgi:hypothetical protein
MELHNLVTIESTPRALAECVLRDVKSQLGSVWLFRIDPDEFVSAELIHAVRGVVEVVPCDAVLMLPFQYYIGERALCSGVWGGRKLIARVMHTSNTIVPMVHSGYIGRHLSLDDYCRVPPIRHKWVRNLREVREKHEHYLKLEGSARLHDRGPWNLRRSSFEVARTAGSVFFKRRPWRDGLLGWQLAWEFVRYQALANVAWWRASHITDGAFWQTSTAAPRGKRESDDE